MVRRVGTAAGSAPSRRYRRVGYRDVVSHATPAPADESPKAEPSAPPGPAGGPPPATAGRTRAPAERFDRLDALRGIAIVWMAAFHFAFDLNHFRFIREDFYTDPFWTTQRTMIVTLFLFCAGVGQAVAVAQGQDWPRFWRRWAQVAGCAVLVSIGSALMFPRSWISFGVLHGVAVMLIVARLSALALHAQGLRGPGPSPGDSSGTAGPQPWAALAIAAAAVLALALPQVVAHPVFDTRWTNWIGLVTRKPVTEDFVPVLPWIGVMLAGLLAGHAAMLWRRCWLAGTVPHLVRPLALLGRWSLSFYIVHQPVFIGLLLVVVWWRSATG